MTVLDVSLRELVSADSPVASVYLRGVGTAEDAAHRFDTRWKNARRSLADAGTPDALVDALDRAIDESEATHAPSLAVFATETMPPVVELLDDELAGDLVAFDDLPRLVPYLHVRQRSAPHLMVTTDRTGADIVAVVDGEQIDADSVEGFTHHIHRGRFGGWSHRRIQQRVENRWESNARDVADRVASIARDIDARVIAITGDVRACQLLSEHLDADVAARATVLEAGDADSVADATVRLVADDVARTTREVLNAVRSPDGGRAAVGVGPVLSALTDGRVEKLLVVDDADDDRRAWYSPDGSPVCSPRRAFESMSGGRLVDVAVRSALLGDADIHVVPATTLEGGIGAILRW